MTRGADDAAEADRGERQEARRGRTSRGAAPRQRPRGATARRRRARAPGPSRPGHASRAVSRIQSRPKTIASAAPTIIAGQLMTRPTRTTAIPIAKPIGQRLWPGAGSRLSSGFSLTRSSPSQIQSVGTRACQRRNSCVKVRARAPFCTSAPEGAAGRPSSAQRASTRDLISAVISISGGHSRRPSAGPLAVASKPILPPYAWIVGRVVELVDRPLAELDVARGIDVRAEVEEDLLVVVHVDVLVDDHDRLRQAHAARAPTARASPCGRARGSSCGSRRCTQLWKAPAVGRS